jgi:hypothetical protein
MKKRGRPIGSIKGKTKQPITVMLKIEDIIAKGGVQASREKIINSFPKL